MDRARPRLYDARMWASWDLPNPAAILTEQRSHPTLCWKGQARAYRKLAAEPAEKFGLSPPSLHDAVSGYFIPALRFDFIRYAQPPAGGDHQP